MHRTLLVLLLLATTTVAQKLPEPEQFIDKSIISFPNTSEQYVLIETHYDPEQWPYGVTSQWSVDGAPEGLRLSVFVYPIGRAGESDAVAEQVADVEHQMHEAVKQGAYSDLSVGERKPFVVVAAKSSILKERGARDADADKPVDLAPQPEVGVEANDASDPLATALAAAQPSANNHGQRQSFRFTREGVPMRSLGYVFYRHLFAFKVRVTAPADSMDDTTFEALADTATRKLVPRIQVENYGQCGSITVAAPHPDADKEALSRSAAEVLLRGMAHVLAGNCAATEGVKTEHEPRGETRIAIVYPPDSWRSEK